VLVVESTLRSGDAVQRVLLHRALVDGSAGGAPDATVFVRTPGGEEKRFERGDLEECVEVPTTGSGIDYLVRNATCFVSRTEGEPWVRPGSTYELHVETPRGERIRGRTTVPGDFHLRMAAQGDEYRSASCMLAPDTQLPLTWSVSEGAWVYLVVMEVRGLRTALEGSGIEDVPEPLELTGLAISARDTTMQVPSNVGIFERARYDAELMRRLQRGFPAGVIVQITTLAADRNFVNGVRGGAFNPSGSVRVSSVVGDGVGVFGSVVPRHLLVFVGDPEPGRGCSG
jgi:hypothetical protein